MVERGYRSDAAGAVGHRLRGNGRPFLFNISGPYAVGKDTILNGIMSTYPELVHRVRTLTTRPVSATADPFYEEVSFEEFEQRTARGRWVVNHQFSGAVAYGTSINEIENAARAGLVCIHSIYAGPSGAGRLREIFGRKVLSIGLLATQGGVKVQVEVLRERLIGRGRDDAATVEVRLQHQIQPLEYVITNPSVVTPDGPASVFDRVIVNEHLEVTVQEVVQLFRLSFLEETQ